MHNDDRVVAFKHKCQEKNCWICRLTTSLARYFLFDDKPIEFHLDVVTG